MLGKCSKLGNLDTQQLTKAHMIDQFQYKGKPGHSCDNIYFPLTFLTYLELYFDLTLRPSVNHFLDILRIIF